MSDQLIRITPITVDPGPERCVLVLESVGGDLGEFIEQCKWHEDKPAEWIITTVERGLQASDDKSLYRRWQAAIKANQITRLRLLQNKAIERMETLSEYKSDDGKIALGWLLLAKEAGAFKLILGDILAGQAHAAKQKPDAVIDTDLDDTDADDVREALEM